MSNPQVKQRIEFLQRYDLVNDKDLSTWENDKTYELEALSGFFTDRSGNPIGLGIYLTELMRIQEIGCKPQPPGDGELKRQLEIAVKDNFLNMVDEQVRQNDPGVELKRVVDDTMEDLIRQVKNEVLQKYKDEINTALENQDIEAVRKELLLQYQHNPMTEIYELGNVANKIIGEVEVTVDWKIEKLKDALIAAFTEFENDTSGPDVESEASPEEIPMPSEELVPFYDVVEKAIGANPDDCEAVHEALTWRLEE